MPPLDRLFALEIEYYSKLRRAGGAGDPSALHTSYALQAGYEPLMRQAAGVTAEQIDSLARRLVLAGDPRDVLAAKDSLIDLFGVRRRGLA